MSETNLPYSVYTLQFYSTLLYFTVQFILCFQYARVKIDASGKAEIYVWIFAA